MDCCCGHLAAESQGEGADVGSKSTISHSLDTGPVAFSVLGTSAYNIQSLQQLFGKTSSDQESDSGSPSEEAIKVGGGDPKGAFSVFLA